MPAILLMGCLAFASANTVTDRQSYTVPLSGDRTLSVEVTVGHLRVIGEPRTDAAIEVVRSVPDKGALSRVPVVLDDAGGDVRLVAVQAAAGTDPALKTDVTLRVPRAARLSSLRLVEGRIHLSGITGAVTADVRRGRIDAENVAGAIRLETGIGDIVAKDVRLTPEGLVRLRAFNGDVRLRLAERPTDARIMALVLDGAIQSDIPLTRRDTWGPRWAEAVLGKGEPVVSLDVVTGSIEIVTK